MRAILILLLPTALASCVAQPPLAAYDGQARVAQLVAGKVAGAARSCLPSPQTTRFETIEGNTAVYREGSRLWINQMSGRCTNLPGRNYTLVTRPFGLSGPCEGDVANVIESGSSMIVGSCMYGDFVPFDGPRS